MVNKLTTIHVGTKIQRLFIGFRSAIRSITPQEKAMADVIPMGYSNFVNPTLSGINTAYAI